MCSIVLAHRLMIPKIILLPGLQILGLLWFLRGFFPRKVTLNGFNEFSEDDSPFATETGAVFEKLIVIVVDALRSDFMYSEDSLMSFLHSLIREGNALPFTAFSHPPTVTLPRLKGITTGGTPSFVDAILNIADDSDQSQGLESVDSWIYQLKFLKEKRVIHFFGDDTWLKLFPPSVFFERFEGTSSFFVSDFTEVDLNVTRHLHTELADNSWDALILHYLGLDHIGHKGGANSVFMKPKQAEMDEVLELIYRSRVHSNSDTLLLMLGDHGMNDIGNHGGASAGETSPGLILASPKFASISEKLEAPLKRHKDFKYYSQMSQIDIVPTLAAMFNIPIPRNNLGIILPDVLRLWADDTSRKVALMENCKQFMHLLAEKFGKTDTKYGCFLSEYQMLKNFDRAPIDSYFSFLRKAQDLLIEESTNYNYRDISMGLATVLLSAIYVWFNLFRTYMKHRSRLFGLGIFFALFCVFYSAHFHGSSLIEEEHQIWWFLSVGVLFLHFYESGFSAPLPFFVVLSCLRLIRGWNDSGQKNSSHLTIFKMLSAAPELNWILVLATYFLVIIQILRRDRWLKSFERASTVISRFKAIIHAFFRLLLLLLVSVMSFIFKLNQFVIDGFKAPEWLSLGNSAFCKLYGYDPSAEQKDLQAINIQLSRIFSGGLLLFLVGRFLAARMGKLDRGALREIINLSTLFLIHQTKIEIIPIFIIFMILKSGYCRILDNLKNCVTERKVILITLFVLSLQNISFFSVGNTNLLATVDLSNAYNGILSYNIALVGGLTFVSNFAVVVYWSLSALEFILAIWGYSRDSKRTRSAVRLRASLTMAFYSISALSLISSCINLRFHLFIWSVFSPKLLYFTVWLVVINSAIDVSLGLVLQATQ